MGRKNFISNCLMALAVALLPKTLLPCMPEVEKEEVEAYNVNVTMQTFSSEGILTNTGNSILTLNLTKSQYAILQENLK